MTNKTPEPMAEPKSISILIKPGTAFMLWNIIRDVLELNRRLIDAKKGGMYYPHEAQALLDVMSDLAGKLDSLNNEAKKEDVNEVVS